MALILYKALSIILVSLTLRTPSLPGVSLPKHGMAVTRHDLARLKGLPDELLELILGEVIADLFAKLLQPDEHLDVYYFVKLYICPSMHTDLKLG